MEKFPVLLEEVMRISLRCGSVCHKNIFCVMQEIFRRLSIVMCKFKSNILLSCCGWVLAKMYTKHFINTVIKGGRTFF